MDEDAFYILDKHGNPVPECDLAKWSQWLGGADRTVANNWFADFTIEVSTVFLAASHIDKHTGKWGMLFETMVFATPSVLARLRELSETDDRSIFAIVFGGNDIQKRYATRAEAERGHRVLCEFVQACLMKGLLPVGQSTQE